MKRRELTPILFIFVLGLLVSTWQVSADIYNGWVEIRPALLDGDGDEFVKPISGLSAFAFNGPTEMQAVRAAANWVVYHMSYQSDPSPPGEVWTSSDQQYAEITPGVQGSGTGDCEDFSILLCALLRFHTYGGIPASRVWVQAGLITVPGEEDNPPLAGHAYVVYKSERGIFYIEPQWGGNYLYRGSYPSLLHWYVVPPPEAGESAMLRFNDQWVKGGGPYLSGPR